MSIHSNSQHEKWKLKSDSLRQSIRLFDPKYLNNSNTTIWIIITNTNYKNKYLMENIHPDTWLGISPLYSVPWVFPAPTQLDYVKSQTLTPEDFPTSQ